MKIYNVDITVKYTIVVSAENDDKAKDAAIENWIEGLQDSLPTTEFDIKEIKSESDLLEGWCVKCVPYGGDGKTTIGDILN